MILEEVCSLIVDAEHKTAPRQSSGFPSIRTPNIGKGRFILDGVYTVSLDTYKKWTRRAIPQNNDLILAREAPVGNVAIIKNGLQPCLGQRTVLIRPNSKKIIPDYLCYFLLGNEMQAQMIGKSGGATVAHLNMKDIRNLELGVLPPLPTQKKIASILSAYDDLIENNLKRIKLLEEAAQNIYKEWFVNFRFPGWENSKFDGESGLPEGWRKEQLRNHIDLIHGFAFKAKEFSEIPTKTMVVRMGNFNEHGGLQLDKNVKYLPNDILIKEKYKLNAGDLLMVLSDVTRDGRIIGNVGILPNMGIDYALNQRVAKLAIKEEMKHFIYASLNSYEFKEHCKPRANGATVLNLKTIDVLEYLITLPSKELMFNFSKRIENTHSIIENIQLQNQKLKEARDILLPRLMNRTIEV